MTEIGKTSSSLLTEEVYAPGTAKASFCSACYAMQLYGSKCYFACEGKRIACPCAYHRECWVDFLRNDCYTTRSSWDSALYRLERANLHDRIKTEHEEARAKAALHRQNKANAESSLGPREFTLTYSPGKHYLDDKSAQDAMRTAIERLTKYYKDEIIEFHAVGEYTAAGRAHVHGWYHLSGGRKITDKNFKRAYPPWNPKRKLGRGFEGGHHQTIERVSDFHGYSEKHLEEAWLVVDIPNANDTSRPASP